MIRQDLYLAFLFFQCLRNVRRQHPTKNLFERLEFACDALKYHNVKARMLYAMKHGPIE